MTGAEVIDVLVKIVVAVGGLAGLTAFLMVRVQKRKIVAETGKTVAEADNFLAEAQSKKTAREISLIEPYAIIHRRLTEELSDAYAEIDWLKMCYDGLAAAMRAAGIEIPPQPARPKRHTPGEVR